MAQVVEMVVNLKCHCVSGITKVGKPLRILNNTVKEVAMGYPKAPAVAKLVHGLILDKYFTESKA